jgi:hypothetical protein
MIHGLGGDGYGKLTQTAGTRIRLLVGGVGGLFTHLNNLRYTSAGTAHTLTIMRDASVAKAASALAAAGTSLVVDTALTDGDGNAIAASDVVAVKLNTGEWHLSVVTSWTANTKTIVLTTAIPAGKSVLKGAPVACYGVAGDTFHASRQLLPAVSVTTNYPVVSGDDVSLCRSRSPGVPLLIDSDNPTAAGTLEMANVLYAKR